MANENVILTALGLDLSQFEKGTSKAVSVTKPLLGAIASIDTELRKIPVVGEIYALTFGKIAEGFAEARTQGRDFARIMQTDVSGSLDGTLKQIDEINKSLSELKTGSFARSISDAFTNVGRGAAFAKDRLGLGDDKISSATEVAKQAAKALGAENVIRSAKEVAKALGAKNVVDAANEATKAVAGKGFATAQADREKQLAELEAKKTQNVENIIGLLQQESNARSAIVSGSQEETDNARNYLEMRERILAVIQEAQKIGGPDSAKWNAEISKSVGEQANLYVEIFNKQQVAADVRRSNAKEELKAAQAIAQFELSGNERDIAYAEEKLALAKLANAERTGVKEDINAATVGVAIARSRTELAHKSYELYLQQAAIETKIMAAEVTGQTRLVKQLEIQARYQIQIQEAQRRGNTELAKQLAAQSKLAQLQEAIRQYELGGRGRAAERREERHRARIARTVQSRLDERGRDQAGQTGLRTNGLISGNLARRTPTRPAGQQPIPNATVQDFMTKVVDALTK